MFWQKKQPQREDTWPEDSVNNTGWCCCTLISQLVTSIRYWSHWCTSSITGLTSLKVIFFIDHRAQAIFLAYSIHAQMLLMTELHLQCCEQSHSDWFSKLHWLTLRTKFIMLFFCSEYPRSHFLSITPDAKWGNLLFFIRDWILVSYVEAFKLPKYLTLCIFSFLLVVFAHANLRHLRRGSSSHNWEIEIGFWVCLWTFSQWMVGARGPFPLWVVLFLSKCF